MLKANISDIPENSYSSPTGKFGSADRDLNKAIGGDWSSMDLTKRWPFAVELTRIPAGKPNYPYHSHASQYEFYIIVSGSATVRHKDGATAAKPGDFFMFGPTEPHQIIADASGDVTYYCIADNPLNDHAYYPDSDKYMVRMPTLRQLVKGTQVDYHHGEDEAK